jgi:hypothetical protein
MAVWMEWGRGPTELNLEQNGIKTTGFILTVVHDINFVTTNDL